MKIGIITVPFNNNYGGFLQAFALKKILEDAGHEVWFINRRRNKPSSFVVFKSKIKAIFRFFAKGEPFVLNDAAKIRYISRNTQVFVKDYLSPLTKAYYTSEALSNCTNLGFDFFIVGSDQVWRYKYAGESIRDFYFSFLKGTAVPRLSYAASFGTSDQEYPDHIAKECSALLSEFKAISVRESSGINVLESVFKVDDNKANVVLDPTFLLDKSDYYNLVEKFKGSLAPRQNYLFTYLLDYNQDKDSLVRNIVCERNLELLQMKAQTGNLAHLDIIEPVEEWLNGIKNASFVVTDSFHGMVFSIIFNKPFLVYINKERGADRFYSLLSQLGIENVLIEQSSDYLGYSEINWNEVNENIDFLRGISKNFLFANLNCG